MRKSWALAIVGLILVIIGLVGGALSIFMAQTAGENLVLSPYGTLALFFFIVLVGDGLFVFFIQRDKTDFDTCKLDVVEAVNHFAKVYRKTHGYPLSRQAVDDIFDGALKCQERNPVQVNGKVISQPNGGDKK